MSGEQGDRASDRTVLLRLGISQRIRQLSGVGDEPFHFLAASLTGHVVVQGPSRCRELDETSLFHRRKCSEDALPVPCADPSFGDALARTWDMRVQADPRLKYARWKER